MVRVSIIGTGDHAYGLAHLFKNNNPMWSGNYLEVAKPNYDKGGYFHDTKIPISDFQDVLKHSDVIILCLPSSAIKTFVFTYFADLKDKILVDPTNSSIPGEDLESILACSNVRWVKAFNDIGAADILLNQPYFKRKILTKMCSRYADALFVVQEFAQVSLGMDVKTVPYENYHEIAAHQNSLGNEWMVSTFILMVLFVLTEIYAVLR